MELLNDAVEVFTPTNEDSKGRVFGYVIGIRESACGAVVYAWVQKSVKTKFSFKDFGVRQRSKKFTNLQEAKSWAIKTQRERASKI